MIAVQHHFRTGYRHEPWTCTGTLFWNYKLRTTGSPFHETSNLSCQQSCEWAPLLDLGKWKAMPCCELVRDGARVNVWCGLAHDRVILLFGTDCEWHLIPTHAETVCTSQLPPETVGDHLITAISRRITLIAQCLADGLVEEQQLPGLLGHQINPTAFFSYSVMWKCLPAQKRPSACTSDTAATVTHNMLWNMWTQVQYYPDICCVTRSTQDEICLGR